MPITSGQKEHVIARAGKPPARIIQGTDTTCWAGAMQSLFVTTWPLGQLEIDKTAAFDQNSIIKQVKWYEKYSGELLRIEKDQYNSLCTQWPALPQVKFVYEEIMGLPPPMRLFVPSRWDLLLGKILSGFHVYLSFNKPEWRNSKSWSWHTYIVWEIVKVKNQMRAKVMDPADGQHHTVDLPAAWHYFMTWRSSDEPLPDFLKAPQRW